MWVEHCRLLQVCDLINGLTLSSGWFDNLSVKFLSVKAAKLLVLAGTDRLDKPLTIAQIQGKLNGKHWIDDAQVHF